MLVPEIAKIGHVSLVTPNLDKSLWFFTEVIGLEEIERQGDTVYLRAWGEFEHHSLVLKAGDEAEVDHVGWRAKRPEDVEGFAKLLQEAGTEVKWIEAGEEAGQGKAIRFRLPSQHTFEIYYDVEKPLAPEGKRSQLKNQRTKAYMRGISPRRIDHVNIQTSMSPEPIFQFLNEKLGFKMREYIKLNNGHIPGGWMSNTPLTHDVALVGGTNAPTPDRLHHIAYFLDNASDIIRACDILRENEVPIDQGPGKHGISQAMLLYVRDPGSGHRLELFSNGYLIFDPDWEPVEWGEENFKDALTWWGAEYIPGHGHVLDSTTKFVDKDKTGI